jgi:hypothetical protein
MYRSSRSRGADSERITVARKNEIYRVRLAHIMRIIGSEGLKEGAIWVRWI